MGYSLLLYIYSYRCCVINIGLVFLFYRSVSKKLLWWTLAKPLLSSKANTLKAFGALLSRYKSALTSLQKDTQKRRVCRMALLEQMPLSWISLRVKAPAPPDHSMNLLQLRKTAPGLEKHFLNPHPKFRIRDGKCKSQHTFPSGSSTGVCYIN